MPASITVMDRTQLQEVFAPFRSMATTLQASSQRYEVVKAPDALAPDDLFRIADVADRLRPALVDWTATSRIVDEVVEMGPKDFVTGQSTWQTDRLSFDSAGALQAALVVVDRVQVGRGTVETNEQYVIRYTNGEASSVFVAVAMKGMEELWEERLFDLSYASTGQISGWTAYSLRGGADEGTRAVYVVGDGVTDAQ